MELCPSFDIFTKLHACWCFIGVDKLEFLCITAKAMKFQVGRKSTAKVPFLILFVPFCIALQSVLFEASYISCIRGRGQPF